MRFRAIHGVILLATVFSGWFVVFTWFRHINFFSASFDLGNMVQVIWQTLHGHFFSITSPTEGVLQSRAAIHADWLLLLYTPFFAVWNDPRVLTTLQVLFVASGVFPMFWLARRQLSARWSLGLITLYLVHPTLQWATIFDIHAVVLATPLVLWGVWAATTKRYVAMWIFFIACWLAKEEVGLVIGLTAAVLTYRKIISPRMGWAIGLLSLGWVALMTAVVIPFFAANNAHFAIGYFSEYGKTVPQIVLGIFRHPVIFFHDVVNIISLGYIAILLASVALLPLRRPLWLLPAAPVVIMNLISNDPHLQSIYYQYTATITPFIMLATIDGLTKILTQYSNRAVAVWATALTSFMVWIWAPLPATRHSANAVEVFQPNPYRHVIRQLASSLPPSTPLVVTNDLGPHFSQRDRVWVFPYAVDQAGAAVILLNRPHDIRPQAELRREVERLMGDPTWELRQQWNAELFYFVRKNIAKISHYSASEVKTPINMGIR